LLNNDTRHHIIIENLITWSLIALPKGNKIQPQMIVKRIKINLDLQIQDRQKILSLFLQAECLLGGRGFVGIINMNNRE
jgi:hypothetical protein